MKRIGFIGLGLKNPYTYAPILKSMGALPSWIWDTYPENAVEFAQKFGCEPISEIDKYPINEADGIIIASINSEHLTLAKPFIQKGVPVLIEKPLSNDPNQAISFLKENSNALFCSVSPLRFSPVYLQMQKDIAESIHLCKVSVYHTMEHFLSDPKKIWHDRYAAGGGMLVDIGIHAIVLLNMFMQKPYAKISYTQSNSRFLDCESGDNHALTIEYSDGSIAQLSLLCSTNYLDYSVEAYSTNNRYENSAHNRYLGQEYTPENAYGGFVGTMEQFLKMIETRVSPISTAETMRNFSLLKDIQKLHKK